MGKSIEDNCLNQWIGLGARTQMVMRTATFVIDDDDDYEKDD